MAPQAIEIAQNGLANPEARRRWEREAIGQVGVPTETGWEAQKMTQNRT